VASVGNAAAAGVTAAVSTTLQTTTGNAAATGVSALLATSVQTTTGNAAAVGITALLPVSVQTATGDASALGVTAAVSTTVGVTISCTVGGAAAAGVSALLNVSLQTSVGNATALGITALINTEAPPTKIGGDDAPRGGRYQVQVRNKVHLFDTDEEAQAFLKSLSKKAKKVATAKPLDRGYVQMMDAITAGFDDEQDIEEILMLL
jgi:hypothetical protein